MNRLLATVLVFGAICVPARAEFLVSSNYCVMPDVNTAYKQAHAVFLGEVTEVVEPVDRSRGPRALSSLFTIKFKVEKAWKGVFTSTFEVLSAFGEGPGLPQVQKGQRYIVYANPALENGLTSPNKWWFASCSRTALVLESEKRPVIRLTGFDHMNGAADERALDWRYPPLIFSAR